MGDPSSLYGASLKQPLLVQSG